MPTPTVDYSRLLDHQAVNDFLTSLAKARPKLATMTELAVSPEGRSLPLLVVTDRTTGEADHKPGYLLHANIHAHELTTTTVALQIAADLVAGAGQDKPITELLRRVAFYIVPRLCPDGAEHAVTTGQSERSRNHVLRRPNALHQADVDGDGQIGWMRWQDPDGELVLHPDDPRLMVRREPNDEGPFYRMMAEGRIEQYDGGTIRSGDRRVDFNRQWPASWQPEHIQGGAGDFPFAEPEMEAIGRFVIGHPNLFAMMGLHTGGNGVLRPSATADDDELPAGDVQVMKDVGEAGAELCGFELYSVRDYCRTYSSDARLRGHFTDWAYQHMGALTFEIELGNLHNSAGLTTAAWRDASPAERERLHVDTLRWSEANDYPSFLPWRPFEHPELGPVELGGWIRPRLANPALPHLAHIAEGCSRFVQHHASLAPRLELRAEAEAVGGPTWRIRAVVANRGGLPTNILDVGRKLGHVEGVRMGLDAGEHGTLLSRRNNVDVGHLGRVTGRAEAEWFVRSRAGETITITAGCPRAGTVQCTIKLPAEMS